MDFGFVFLLSDFGLRISDLIFAFGCRSSDIGFDFCFRMSVFGLQSLDIGLWIWDLGFRILVIEFELSYIFTLKTQKRKNLKPESRRPTSEARKKSDIRKPKAEID